MILFFLRTVGLGEPPPSAGHEPGDLGVWRDKLLKFLKSSSHYTPERLLTQFPSNQVCHGRKGINCGDNGEGIIGGHCGYLQFFILLSISIQFFEERAILLGRSGRHEDALAIYVLVLNDLVEAEAYCERVISAPGATTDAKHVFLHLLRLYLDPQSG